MDLIKSKERVSEFGEVFTPPAMVEAMLELVREEAERIDSRFLEPACGGGNFLKQILQRKLLAVDLKYAGSNFDRHNFAALAIMSIYGIEILQDNVDECRISLIDILTDHLNVDKSSDIVRSAKVIVASNIIHGDALAMLSNDGCPITFPEWAYVGKGKFQRRDFRLDYLTQSAAFSAQDSLFSGLEKHQLFTPIKEYPLMTLREIADLGPFPDPMVGHE